MLSPIFQNFKEFSSQITIGSANIDTLNNIYFYNISSIRFKDNQNEVANGNPRASSLLMYDLIMRKNDQKYTTIGVNFTWTSSDCTCSPIKVKVSILNKR